MNIITNPFKDLPSFYTEQARMALFPNGEAQLNACIQSKHTFHIETVKHSMFPQVHGSKRNIYCLRCHTCDRHLLHYPRPQEDVLTD